MKPFMLIYFEMKRGMFFREVSKEGWKKEEHDGVGKEGKKRERGG